VRRPHSEASAERLDPIREAAQAGATLAVGAADAIVDHLDDELIGRVPDGDGAGRCLRVLRDVREALADNVVGSNFDRLRKPLFDVYAQPDWKWRPRSDLLQRHRQPVRGYNRRMESA
jgi:hypothetical protein